MLTLLLAGKSLLLVLNAVLAGAVGGEAVAKHKGYDKGGYPAQYGVGVHSNSVSVVTQNWRRRWL